MTERIKRPMLLLLAAIMAVCAVAVFPQKAQAARKYIVVVDPGHGYNQGRVDSGAVAPDGTWESKLNVELAARIAVKLKKKGYTVYSTLPIGNGIPSLLKNNIPNITLSKRAACANAKGADLFIAVHHNSAGSTFNDACGAMVLYDERQGAMAQRSHTLANAVYNSMAELGYTVGNRVGRVINQGATVLKENRAPAITLEAGFLSNPWDLARAKDAPSREELAGKVADGIENYLDKYGKKDNKPPSKATKVLVDGKSTVRIRAYGIKDAQGVKNVAFSVFPKGQKSKAKAIKGVYKGGGTWLANINVKKLFGNRSGQFAVSITATDKNGNTGIVGKAYFDYKRPA